jgi:hypothetical protein
MEPLKLTENESCWRAFAGAERFKDGSKPLFAELPDGFFNLETFKSQVLSLSGNPETGAVVVGVDAVDEDYRSVNLTLVLPFSKKEAKAWVERTLIEEGKGLTGNQLVKRFGFVLEPWC